jgi:hypothetical protein
MTDAIQHDACGPCPLPDRVSALESEVAAVRGVMTDAVSELRTETARLNDVFGSHIKALAEVIMRFNAQLEHARLSMSELTTGLAELGVSVKANMKRRTMRARRAKEG